MSKPIDSSRRKRRYVRFTRWRRRRFFALLSESGNVRAAAELSGVGLGCIYRLRRTEAGFVAAMAAAKDAADARLGRGGLSGDVVTPRPLIAGAMGPSVAAAGSPPGRSQEPPRSPGERGCGERGDGESGDFDDLVIRRGVGGRLRRMAAGSRWWSARHDAIFLGHLRMTGNVAASARAAGFTPKSAWNRCGRMPSFAAAMDAALAEAEGNVQSRLTAEAINGNAGMDYEAQVPAMCAALEEPLDVELALRLLTWRERRARERRG